MPENSDKGIGRFEVTDRLGAEEDAKADYEDVTEEELISNMEQYDGKKIRVTTERFEVSEGLTTQFGINILSPKEGFYDTEQPYYKRIKDTIQTMRENTDVLIEKDGEKVLSYNFTYKKKWTIRYTDTGIVLRIWEPQVYQYLREVESFMDASLFGNGYAETFEYDPEKNLVYMYGGEMTQSGDFFNAIKYDITNDQYTLLSGKGREDEYVISDDETEEWIRDSLESTDWKTIFNQDLQECMSGFSSKGITLEKIEEVTPQIIERYSYLVK